METARLREPAIILFIVIAIAGAVVITLLSQGFSKHAQSSSSKSNERSIIDTQNATCVTVMVRGHGSCKTMPVSYLLVIQIQNEKPSMNVGELFKSIVRQYSKIVSILRKNGFEVYTKDISIRPSYSWYGSHRVFQGYYVRVLILAYTNDIKQVENILPLIALRNVSLSFSYVYNYSKVKECALQNAIQDALKKIYTISHILGYEYVKILQIEEYHTYTIVPTLKLETEVPIYEMPKEIYASVTVKAQVCKSVS